MCRALKTITITAYNRPEYLRQALDALSSCRRVGEYVIFAVVDPSDRQFEVQAELERFCEGRLAHVVLNKRRLGCDYNNFFAYQLAFGAGSQFNFAVEDDIIVSPDSLEMAEWAWSRWPPQALGFCLFNRNLPGLPKPNPFEVARNNLFNAWGWACPVKVFRRYVEPNWMCHQRWWKGDAQVWDRSMTQIALDYQMFFIRPDLSRVRNIGADGDHTNLTGFVACKFHEMFSADIAYDEESYFLSQEPVKDHAEVFV